MVLAGLIDSRSRLILAAACVLSGVGAVVSLLELRLDADTNSLIGDHRPFMKTYREYLDRYGDLEAIYVVVDAGERLDTQAARKAVDELTEALGGIPELRSVRGRITPEEQWRLALHAMPASRLDDLLQAGPALATLLKNDDVHALITNAKQELARSMAPHDQDIERRITSFANGVLLLETLTDTENEDGLTSERSTRYLTSVTGRMHFIEIMPDKNFDSLSVIDGALDGIRESIEMISNTNPEVRIGLTGKPVLQADELETSARDMTRATILALGVVSILFVLYFRELKRPLCAVLAFVVAFGWTYGAATLIVGRLNLLSMVFMLVLVGAGIDYGVHVLARWRESRALRTRSDSLRDIMRSAVTGNITGAATSAGVFFLALLTDFQGLRELGIIAGLGLIFCAISMTLVLPSLLILTERENSAMPCGDDRIGRNPTGSHAKFRDGAIVALSLASLIPAGLFAFRSLEFESNLLSLQSPDLDSVFWENALFEDDSSGSWFGAVIVDDLAGIPDVIDRARRHQEIGPIRSALDFVDVPDDQRTSALEAFLGLRSSERAIRSMQSDDVNHSVTEELRQCADSLGTILEFDARRIDPKTRLAIETLQRRLEDMALGDETLTAERLEHARKNARQHLSWMIEGADQSIRSVLPEAVRSRFSAEDGSYAVLMQPKENVWAPEEMGDFVAALREVSPDVTGVPITQHESIREMHQAFLMMAWGAIFVVAFALWLDFRSGRQTLACMATLGLAMVWTLGAMAIMDLSINLANFFAIPILIGLGADSAIHVVHRWRLITRGEEVGFGGTLKAVALTTGITGIGFGTLILAHHQGLRSLGWVMVLGSTSTLLAGTVVLPCGLRLTRGLKSEKKLAVES